MADQRFNDENLSKLTEEFTKKKNNNFSGLDDESFREFFENKDDDAPSKAGLIQQKQDSFRSASNNSSHAFASGKGQNKKTGLFSGFMYFIFIISVSIILACLCWMAASDILALNKEEISAEIALPSEIFTKETRTVKNSDGSTETKTYNKADMREVADILKDNGIIEYKSLFLIYSSVSDANIKLDPGTYELSTIYDYRAIVKKMQFGSGAMLTSEITFPEGLTVEEIFKLLEKNQICTYDELMEYAANMDFGYSVLSAIPYGKASRLEGYLFPDTYEFYQGTTAQAAIDTFLQIFNSKVTGEMIEQAATMGYSIHDIIKIASMIEKEAANDEERPIIAGVIYNRLKQDMPLQIDATIQYILPEHSEYITIADTQTESPYNTYLNKGLPIGPISNPGLASINAALNPETTSYIYYALDESTNTHKFFVNFNDFSAFTATQSYGQ